MLFKLEIEELSSLADDIDLAVDSIESFENALEILKDLIESDTKGKAFKTIVEQGELIREELTGGKEELKERSKQLRDYIQGLNEINSSTGDDYEIDAEQMITGIKGILKVLDVPVGPENKSIQNKMETYEENMKQFNHRNGEINVEEEYAGDLETQNFIKLKTIVIEEQIMNYNYYNLELFEDVQADILNFQKDIEDSEEDFKKELNIMYEMEEYEKTYYPGFLDVHEKLNAIINISEFHVKLEIKH